MHESFEFRVVEEFASSLFAPEEGKRLSNSIREIKIERNDVRFERIGELQQELISKLNRSFFHGWEIHYNYTKKELETAELFHLDITSVFEPAGESCGTEYDEWSACPECGSGATQKTGLWLDLRKAPKSKDIARTIADEWIVSQRLGELLIDSGLTGFELRRVRHKARYEDDPIDLQETPTGRLILEKAEEAGCPKPTWQFYVWLNRAENQALWDMAVEEQAAMKQKKAQRRGKPAPIWYQLVVTSPPVELVPPTKTGVNPFDDDPKGEFRCSRGDLIGLNLLSEAYVGRDSYDGSDVAVSRQFVGTRRGLLRPTPLLLISPRFWRLLEAEKIKGYKVEVAHLVDR